MSLFEAHDLTYSVGGRRLVSGVSFALQPGTLTALVGPNGAGKTTMLRMGAGLVQPDHGGVQIGGSDLAQLSPSERARKLAYLPQNRPLVWPQPVRDLVALGRFAFGGAPSRLSPQDEEAIAGAMTACKLEGFEERIADTLSGGELSRVHLARALAAETQVLIADEPVTALDPRHAHDVLRLFKNAAKEGRAILTVVHDLALAARYADRLIWIKQGQVVADGHPQEIVTADRLRSVFGVEARVERDASGTVLLDIHGPASFG